MTPFQAANDFLSAASADTAAVLVHVPDLVKVAALIWCAALLTRAVLRAGVRRFLRGLDWWHHWDAEGPGLPWRMERTRASRAYWSGTEWEVWAGRLYVVVSLPRRQPVAGSPPPSLV